MYSECETGWAGVLFLARILPWLLHSLIDCSLVLSTYICGSVPVDFSASTFLSFFFFFSFFFQEAPKSGKVGKSGGQENTDHEVGSQ